ncbi:MAG TPA: M3 family metallopeptidase [Burkholderiaceae bacterium]|nr:M3 family metallopeptidase [Burkholderiaceae bacterium]
MNPNNPLLHAWDTPHQVPPFGAIRAEHFAPAFDAAMQARRAEIEAIAADPAPVDFANTAARFDAGGRAFARVEAVFYNLCASQTSPELQAVQRAMAKPLAAHSNAIYLHDGLFARLDELHAKRDALTADAEQRRLVERLHSDFVRAGARLAAPEKTRLAALNERLADLMTRFSQNVLADETTWRLALAHEGDLAGLPDFVRAAARQAAVERGLAGHVITLSRSLIVPFLTFSERRDLREAAWRAWTSRGAHDGATDNRPLVREILEARAEQAALLGYATYADFALADNMAGSVEAVMALLDNVGARALAVLARERADLEALMREQGATHALEAWDWRWWAEKLRQRRYAIDDADVKPYFALDRMVEAAFDCATRLFGIRFVARTDIPTYHPDVRAYEVKRADGSLVGVFLHDNFARPGKKSGAWMSSYRRQSRNGADVRPIIVNNNNFAQTAPGEPTLLSFDDVRTLFHEFGHGLHGLLSDVGYERLSGTNVLRDFVELPSQLFEHWMGEPAVLRRHARHIVTGEAIPDALIERLQAARRFGAGYETTSYVASALTDIKVHSLPRGAQPADPVAFEESVLRERAIPECVGARHRFAHFQHLFSGSSYAAGYYVYLWAEVLDADAFDAFVEAGDPFDAEVARRLQRHIYGAGDSVEPGATYAAFRGRAARIEPMLQKKGLLQPA